MGVALTQTLLQIFYEKCIATLKNSLVKFELRLLHCPTVPPTSNQQ